MTKPLLRYISSVFLIGCFLGAVAQPPNPDLPFNGIAAVTDVTAVVASNTWDITIASWEGGYNLIEEEFALDSLTTGDVMFLNCVPYEVTNVYSVTAGAVANIRVVANIAAEPTISATANAAFFRLSGVAELPALVQAVTNPGESGLSKIDNACLLNYLVAQISATLALDTISISIEGDIKVNTQYFPGDGTSDITEGQMQNWLDTTNILSLSTHLTSPAADNMTVTLPSPVVYQDNLIEITNIDEDVATYNVTLSDSLWVNGELQNTYVMQNGERVGLISVLINGARYWALGSAASSGLSVTGLCNLGVNQSSHGFSKWDPVIRRSGGYVLAADTTGIDGIVVDSISQDSFALQMCGYVESTHSFIVGADYYVQRNGSLDTLPDEINNWAITILATDIVQIREVRPYSPLEGDQLTPDGNGLFSVNNNNDTIAVDSAHIAADGSFKITMGSDGLLLQRFDGIANPLSYLLGQSEIVVLGDLLGNHFGSRIVVDNFNNGRIDLLSDAIEFGTNEIDDPSLSVEDTKIEINLGSGSDSLWMVNLSTINSNDHVLAVSAADGGKAGTQHINKTRSWTIRTSNPGVNEEVDPGEGLIIDGSTAGWTVTIDPSNLVAGDLIRIKIVDANANTITLDSTSGEFYYADSTTVATIAFSGDQHDLELFWNGTNFIVFE